MTDAGFATLPPPPYWVVIFSSRRSEPDPDYDRMAGRMMELAAVQPGFLGAESTRGTDGFGITVSYWTDEASIVRWKEQAGHRVAQELGRTRWYEHYELRIARVERAYGKTTTAAPGSGR